MRLEGENCEKRLFTEERSVHTNSESCNIQLTALKNKIFAIKFNPLNLESQNQAKNIPVVLPSSPIKI